MYNYKGNEVNLTALLSTLSLFIRLIVPYLQGMRGGGGGRVYCVIRSELDRFFKVISLLKYQNKNISGDILITA